MSVNPNLTIPDGITPFLGYRLWRAQPADNGSWTLRSPLYPHLWTGGRQEAVCHISGETNLRKLWADLGKQVDHGPSEVPAKGCVCGFHASTTEMGALWGSGALLERMLVGSVKLWGRVIPGERGWRAQYARVQELSVIKETLREDDDVLEIQLALTGSIGMPVGVRSLPILAKPRPRSRKDTPLKL
jgi:hypothetical protein